MVWEQTFPNPLQRWRRSRIFSYFSSSKGEFCPDCFESNAVIPYPDIKMCWSKPGGSSKSLPSLGSLPENAQPSDGWLWKSRNQLRYDLKKKTGGFTLPKTNMAGWKISMFNKEIHLQNGGFYIAMLVFRSICFWNCQPPKATQRKTCHGCGDCFHIEAKDNNCFAAKKTWKGPKPQKNQEVFKSSPQRSKSSMATWPFIQMDPGTF